MVLLERRYVWPTMNHRALMLTSLLAALLLPACANRSSKNEPVPEASALGSANVPTPSTSISTVPSAPPAPPTPSASASASAVVTQLLASVPILDAAKGNQAAAEYRTIIEKACGKGSGRGQALKELGLSIEDADFVCVDFAHAAKPLASGSFVDVGADEVLIQGRSGRSWAGGDSTLALMRKEGEKYRLVQHLFNGQGFQPILRVTTPRGRDILMLCENGGHMGLYPSVCGFLGELSFEHGSSAIGAAMSETNEIHTLGVTLCGPQKAVKLGKIEMRNEHLYAPLFVEELLNEPENADETTYCSRETKQSRKMFTVEYHYDGMRFRRMTAIPKEAKDILDQY